jgi:hypothetical protein
MANDRLMHVHIVVNDISELNGLELDNECMPIRQRKDGKIELKAFAPARTITKLRAMKAQGVSVRAQALQIPPEGTLDKLVSSTNRYAKGAIPRGVGKRKP